MALDIQGEIHSSNCCCLYYSVQRMRDLGDESKLLPLWRQVTFGFGGYFFSFLSFLFAGLLIHEMLLCFGDETYFSDVGKLYSQLIKGFRLSLCFLYFATGRTEISLEQLYTGSAHR